MKYAEVPLYFSACCCRYSSASFFFFGFLRPFTLSSLLFGDETHAWRFTTTSKAKGPLIECRPMRVIQFCYFCPLIRSVVSGWEPSRIVRRPNLSLKSKSIQHGRDHGAQNEDIWSMEALSLEQFRRRRDSFERKDAQQHLLRPPNPFLNPKQFVTELLCELRHPRRQQQSGLLCLLESSTPEWRKILYGSVGAAETATDDQVAASLEHFFRRPNNQFGILVGTEHEDHLLNFPSDPLDYEDGTCWVECRIRSTESDELLVVTGWSLEQRVADGAWLVNMLDWQDFREAFRPGIGREEWERYVNEKDSSILHMMGTRLSHIVHFVPVVCVARICG